MVKQIITLNQNTIQEFDISGYTSITVFNRGGTANTTIQIGADNTVLVTKASVAADSITTITDNAIILKITPGTGASYDIVGELR